MVHCVEALKKISLLLAPFMPLSCEKMWEALGGEGEVKDQKIKAIKEWGTIQAGTRLKKIPALFPRIQTAS
jgi:methionyl-tRNA synthetase